MITPEALAEGHGYGRSRFAGTVLCHRCMSDICDFDTEEESDQ